VWAEMIDAFAHDRQAVAYDDDLGGGAGEHRRHLSLSVV
jgi:hypothetical protein